MCIETVSVALMYIWFVWFSIVRRLNKLEDKVGSIANELGTIQAALTKTQGDVSTLATGVVSLNTTVTDLQAELANQGDVLSPSSQALLDTLVAQSGTLQTAADAAAAELPVSPAPTPTPGS